MTLPSRRWVAQAGVPSKPDFGLMGWSFARAFCELTWGSDSIGRERFSAATKTQLRFWVAQL
jgi:hypothetical protein